MAGAVALVAAGAAVLVARDAGGAAPPASFPPAPSRPEDKGFGVYLRPDDPNNPIRGIAENVPGYGALVTAGNALANDIEERTGVDISLGKYASAAWDYVTGWWNE